MRLRVIELFAGCGGAALGLTGAGWEHVACVEHDRDAAATLRAAGYPVIEQDVRKVDFTPWSGRTDLVWASPPCQAGSVAGRRAGSCDERNGWPWLFDALDVIRPTWLLCENVRGWTYHRVGCDRGADPDECVGCYWEREVLPQVRSRFEAVGWWKLDAADFGTPQHRRRVILWAGPLPLSPDGPTPSHGDPEEPCLDEAGRAPWVTLAEAVGATLLAPETCEQRRCYPCDGSHGAACSQPWRQDRPAPTVTTTDAKGTRAHAPAWTIRGGPDRASDAAFLVAGVRRISIEEGLVLQGLPEDWPLQGTVTSRYRQVGNAVPPQLAEATGRAVHLAERIRAHLEETGQDLCAMRQALERQGRSVPADRA